MHIGFKIALPVVVSFFIGFAIGYKSKEFRIKWSRRKRDKLLAKLTDAQKQLEILTSM